MASDQTLFAFDCGATNWRLYRAAYRLEGGMGRLLGEPQPSPLTSFVNRSLPAMFLLNPAGTGIENIGEVAQQGIEDEKLRERLREYFKPCIGAHLEHNPLPHQKRYTHSEALSFTSLLLKAVLDQLRLEKWQGRDFDDRVVFTFSYPVHWRDDHQGQVFEDFKRAVQDCFSEGQRQQVRFTTEPEAAILSLERQGLLSKITPGKVTLILDAGGSTIDLVAGQVDTHGQGIAYARRYGEPHGGGLYDAEIAKYLADELKIPASALADDPSSLVALQTYGRQLKESLSRQILRASGSFVTPQRTITLVTRSGEVYRSIVKLDEATFNNLARHLIVDFQYLVENAMQTLGLRDSDIGQVILVGGGAQLFTLVGHLRQRFGEKAILLADNPEEVVVQGAALEYGRSFEIIRQRAGLPVSATAPQAVPPPAVPLPTPAVSPWRLISSSGQEYPLMGDVIKMGRKSDNQVWLKDNQASRYHAEIRQTTGGWLVVDLGSTNGTFLNGERLPPKQPRMLKPGDRLRIGQANFVIAHSPTG